MVAPKGDRLLTLASRTVILRFARQRPVDTGFNVIHNGTSSSRLGHCSCGAPTPLYRLRSNTTMQPSFLPRTFTVKSPHGVVTVSDVSVREYSDAQKSRTFDDLVRTKMIVSITKPSGDIVLATDLPAEEMESAVAAVKAKYDADDAKMRNSLGKFRDISLGLSNIGISRLSAFATKGLYTGLDGQARSGVVGVTRLPPSSFSPLDYSDAVRDRKKREQLALESQIKATKVLEEIHEKIGEAEQRSQGNHKTQTRRNTIVAVASLTIAIIGVVVGVLI